jgi:cell division protein YceG involved in septum cleavage
MKTFISNHCYTIVISGLVFIFSLYLSLQNNSEDPEQYHSVTVSTGDTLWEMADNYQTHNLTRQEFIDWTIENNELEANRLKPGDTIIIPVSKQVAINNLADSQ